MWGPNHDGSRGRSFREGQGLPDNAPSNTVNVDCSPYWEQHVDKDPNQHIGDPAHSWHIGDPVMTQDWVHTIGGDIDRRHIPTRQTVDRRLILTAPQ